MRMIRFERVQKLGINISSAWDFISNPANLARITPPDLRFRLTAPLPARMHPGMLASYTITPFDRIRIRWVTEITHVTHPIMFVDEQRFGPYRFWHHQHHFRELDDGVEMRDIVHYMLPFDPFSRLVAGLVARRLEYIFDFRREAIPMHILQE